MAYANDTTRRSLLAIATVATLLPGAVHAAPDPWTDLISTYGRCHPNALAAITKARGAGLDPLTFVTISLAGAPSPEQLPILWFGDVDAGNYTAVTPVSGTHYMRFQ